MIIQRVPIIFQCQYRNKYPPYSSGKNMEEIFFEYFDSHRHTLNSNYVYLPVFWSAYYAMKKDENILKNWLHKLDKTKKYFTVVQNIHGIIVNNYDLNITVFGTCGGLNLERHNLFKGKKGNYDIPLLSHPSMPIRECEKDIFCSFMGSYDTHPCRQKMRDLLVDEKKYIFKEFSDFNEYCILMNKSIFSLCPRGIGYTSFRLYEAIMCGSIPIYIWEDDYCMPFSEYVQWRDFCIVIESKDIEKLPSILSHVNVDEIQKNLENAREVLTFDKTYEYICKKITIH